MKDITELHLCASFDEYNSLYRRVFAKWCIDYNEFATTLSSGGIQEQISQTGKYSLVNLVCAQLIMHWNRLMPCSSAVTQIIVAIHCLHYLTLLCRPSLSTYLEKSCMDIRLFTTSVHLIDYPSLMPIALLQIIMSYWYNAQW